MLAGTALFIVGIIPQVPYALDQAGIDFFPVEQETDGIDQRGRTAVIFRGLIIQSVTRRASLFSLGIMQDFWGPWRRAAHRR